MQLREKLYDMAGYSFDIVEKAKSGEVVDIETYVHCTIKPQVRLRINAPLRCKDDIFCSCWSPFDEDHSLT